MTDGLPESPSSLGSTSRRGLIAHATRRLALLSGGMFVAIGLEDALARKGSFGGHLGGRHGKNQRSGHHKHHNHKHRKNHKHGKNNQGLGGGPSCNVNDDCPGTNQACCNNQCIDIQSDPKNCGGCGTQCNARSTCLNGQCQECHIYNGNSTTWQQWIDSDVLAPGATLRICPGTYNQRVHIGKNLTLVGVTNDPDAVVLTGQGRLARAAVLTVDAGKVVTLRNMSITGGHTNKDGIGAGISNFGELTLEHVHVTNNDAENFNGGGIANIGANAKLTLDQSVVANNEATNGAGISNQSGQVTLRNASQVENNIASGRGGGIHTSLGGVTLERSEASGNAAGQGGGLYNDRGTVNLTVLSGIDGNTANSGGGVFNFPSSTLSLSGDAFVTRNTATGGSGQGGGVLNQGTVTTGDRFTISGNTPDDCVNNSGGTGCPA